MSDLDQGTTEAGAPSSGHPGKGDFLALCKTATEKLFMERRYLRRIAVRIGFWPDGMVIMATISARSDAELEANVPKVIPWSELETITEASLLAAVDEVCNRAREALKPRTH